MQDTASEATVEEIDEIVHEFLVESHENLDQLDRDLLALEHDGTSHELLSSVFRTIHTIKGTSGFLAFTHLEALTHVGESLLSRLRDGDLELTPQIAAALLQMVDAVRGLLLSLERTGAEGEPDHSEIIALLTELQQPEQSPEAAPAAEAAPAREAVQTPESVELSPVHPPADAGGPKAAPQSVRAPLLGELLVDRGVVGLDEVSQAVLAQSSGDRRRLGEILVGTGAIDPDAVTDALDVQAAARSTVVDSTVRVDVELLDDLMTLVGELVLARNQLVSHAVEARDPALNRVSQRLNLIASELQEGVMKTRMQPIGTVWSRLPRVVRDLAQHLGKSVRVETEGRETELDRSVIEAVRDPLTHLVRNAVDHGIETPAERRALGKPAEALLRLRAHHEGGQVNIEISDDGRGLDLARIETQALQHGLVAEADLKRMTPREVANLVFLPGFSTADQVSSVSGRGVGLDVVKSNIERIGGQVDLQTWAGRGTTFRVKIPLTLAIIPALTVLSGGGRYAIPQVNLLELVRIDAERVPTAIEDIQGAPVHRLRGRLLPLVQLDQALRARSQRAEERGVVIVVLQAEDRQFGLVVDDVVDTQEIVVKPLSTQLQSIPVYAGATILGDGGVALILDVVALAQQSDVLATARERVAATAERAEASVEDARESLLVVALSDGRRVAVPLSAVTRLEEIAAGRVERVGAREVVQYRGEILPLVRLTDLLGAPASAPQERVRVVVHQLSTRRVGLVVDAIHDIVEQVVTTRSELAGHGMLGSAVVQDRVVELLDVEQALGHGDVTALVPAQPSAADEVVPA
jgi:two-component system chemotaxis sensor kinase CheA